MKQKKKNDLYILSLLARSPQDGMILLLEEYTGLIWKITAKYLQNPEDIKECVNETFVQFYLQRKNYNPSLASLPLYLTTIARNIAVSRYRKEKLRAARRLRAEDLKDNGQISEAELRMDINEALKSLRPDELQIIQMKYYDGMTIREIASSLNLPYETVKKRHYRILGKLRRSMIIALIALALFLLTACTYGILRHYGIVPDIMDFLSFIEYDNLSSDDPADRSPGGSSGPIRPSAADRIPSVPSDSKKESDEGTDLSADRSTVDQEPDFNSQEDAAQKVTAPGSKLDSLTSSSVWVNGYGISSEKESYAYALAERSSFENEYVTGELYTAVYAEQTLKATVKIQAKGASFYELAAEYFPESDYTALVPDFSVLYLNGEKIAAGTTSSQMTAPDTLWSYYTFTDIDLPLSQEQSDSPSSPVLSLCGESDPQTESLPLRLVPVESVELGGHICKLNDSYGILAFPEHTDEESLKVSLYPLSAGDGPEILPSLIYGSYGRRQEGAITLTGASGKEYQGNCIRYRPADGMSSYFEWDFGEVPPGEYMLHIPFLCLSGELPEDFLLPLPLMTATSENTSSEISAENFVKIPGGLIAVEEITQVNTIPGERIPGTYVYAADSPNVGYWAISLRTVSTIPDVTIIDIFPGHKAERSGEPFPQDGSAISSLTLNAFEVPPSDPGIICMLAGLNTKFYNPESFCLTTDSLSGRGVINYRWDIQIDIPVTVPEP